MLQQVVFAECVLIKKITEVKSCVRKILEKEEAKNVLILFDVDTTLIQYIKKPTNTKKQASYQKPSSNLTIKEKELSFTKTFHKNKMILIDNAAPELIKELQTKGVKVIAYTSSLVNPDKSISNKMLFKFRDALQKIGLDFTAHELPTSVKPLQRFRRYFNDYPTFYHGILSTNGQYNKNIDDGAVLLEFLQSLTPERTPSTCGTYKPKTIIFVSSDVEKMSNIESKLSTIQPNIEFICLQCTNSTHYEQ